MPGQRGQVGGERQPADDSFNIGGHLFAAGAVEGEKADGAFEVADPVQQVDEVGAVPPGRRIELEVTGYHGWGPALDPFRPVPQRWR